MNLARDPWIPALMLDGKSRLISLRDAFASGEEIADLAVNPSQRVAVIRLLVCVGQAALDGPKDEDGWAVCRTRLGPLAVVYLDRWRERFDLFGPRPFLQVDDFEQSPNALADKLDLTRACGNNPTLFDHSATPTGRQPSAAKLAMDLLVSQVYSPGGRIGRLEWDGRITVESCELAPALEGSLLHTIIRGTTLLETVHANLLTRNQVMEWGRPVWELDRLLRAPLETNARSYLGRLVPVTRAIRCSPGSRAITLAAAVPCAKLPEGREPMGTVVLRKKGDAEFHQYLRVDLSKHPWRELTSILSLGGADRPGGPLALAHLRGLLGGRFDIWTGGVAADKSKLLDMAEWSFSLSRALLDQARLRLYRAGVDRAEDGARGLMSSVKHYGDALHSESPPTARALVLYWSSLDRQSAALEDAACTPGHGLDDLWVPLVINAMRDAYERSCAHESPRQLQAYARGLAWLTRAGQKLRTGSTSNDARTFEAENAVSGG
jgi:CRISPR system Cascade subunit CasA